MGIEPAQDCKSEYPVASVAVPRVPVGAQLHLGATVRQMYPSGGLLQRGIAVVLAD